MDERKPRSDAKLKNLPRGVQDEIIRRMKEAVKNPDGTESSTSIDAIIAWIAAECGKDTSAGALSKFWQWYHLRDRMALRENRSLNLVDILRKMKLGLSEDELMKIGNCHFLEEGVESGDSKVYLATVDRVLMKRDGETRAKHKEAELDLKKRRMTLLEKKDADTDHIKKATGGKPSAEMTPEVRELVLAAVDESLGLKPIK